MGDGPDLDGPEDPNSSFDLGGGSEEESTTDEEEDDISRADGSTAIPEGEPEPGEDENWDNASKDARSRARQRDLPIVQPPAVDEEVVPVCFGEFDPDEKPCGECAVEKDCQKRYLGL